MQTQYSVLGYRIDLDFSNHNLTIEIDENGHSHRNIDYEIKRQKAVKQELGCKYIRIAQDVLMVGYQKGCIIILNLFWEWCLSTIHEKFCIQRKIRIQWKRFNCRVNSYLKMRTLS